MNKRVLFENIIKRILPIIKNELTKYNNSLYESISFDDDDDDDDIMSDTTQEISLEVIEKTLLDGVKPHADNIYTEGNTTYVKYNDPSDWRQFAGHPRKLKQYLASTSKDRLYSYIIKNNPDGIQLGILQYSKQIFNYQKETYVDTIQFLELSNNVIRYINESYIPIKEIYIYNYDGKIINTIERGIIFNFFEIDSYTNRPNYKKPIIIATEQFATNFPSILPKLSDPSKYDMASESKIKPVILMKTCFESNDDFYKVAKKCIDNGFRITDDEYIVYDEKNINKFISNPTFMQNEKQEKEDNNSEWVKKQLGDVYVRRLEALISTLLSMPGNKHIYLRTLCTFRTPDALLGVDMVKQLAADNNMNFEIKCEDPNDPDILSECVTEQCKRVVYKFALKLYADNPNGWNGRERPDYDDFFKGGVYDNGYYTTAILPYGLNVAKTSLGIDKIADVWYLYYGLAYALLNTGYDELSADDNQSRKAVNDFNNNEPNMNTFNFNVLTTTLQNIIDKQCKKLKIKIK